MLDPNLLRNGLDEVAAKLAHKGFILDKQAYSKLETQRKNLQNLCESLQAERNTLAKQIGKLKAQKQDATEALEASALVAKKTKKAATDLNETQAALTALLSSLPNLPADDVPKGTSEKDNALQRVAGTITPEKDTHDHVTIAASGLSMSKGGDICGSRFAFLFGSVAKLHRVLTQWMLDVHTNNGYLEVNSPVLVKPSALYGTGQLPKFSEDLFATDSEQNLTLIPTAEVSLTNLVAHEIVPSEKLPLRYVAATQCFRKEAGSYGKDTQGMFRVHQFEKVELVHICTAEQSEAEHERLLANACSILDLLELPYRVVELCGGDLGFSAQKTYDIEVWLPSQKSYREISSCSNMGSFQARRMLARTRLGNQKKTDFVHTLNGSGLAVGRTLIAVLEHYQNSDGSISVPRVLQNAMGCKSINPSEF